MSATHAGEIPGAPIEALGRWIATRAAPGRPLVLGINGAQGSGKTTLAERLQHALGVEHRLRAVTLSLDDFYLPRTQREDLARSVHPLLATRGVPGTHDVGLLSRVLIGLRAGRSLQLPRFVKAEDDRAPAGDGVRIEGPVDVVLFEGWCVGTPPQDPGELAVPINALEAEEDGEGRWRTHVNDQLAGPYARVFRELDRLVFLKAPGFEVVHGWRLEQEAGNAATAKGATRVMDAAALHRFIAHYERLTRHALRVLTSRADVVIELDDRRRATAIRIAE